MTRGAKSMRAHELLGAALVEQVERARVNCARVLGHDHDDEALHDLRVGVRRMRVLLRAARSLYTKKWVTPLEDELRRLGCATNALRDREVLRESLAPVALDLELRARTQSWLDANLDTDAELRQAVKRTLAEPASVMLFDAIRSLAGSVPRRDRRAFNFAEAQLRAAERGVSALLPVAPTDGPRLHRLRIRMKRLRYFCEAFAPLAEDGPEGAALADRLALRAKDAARFQKELGLVHDLDVALERVADGGGALLGPAVVAAIRELRDSHATHAVERLTGELADFASTPS